jgi:hypothetical protein
MLPSGYAAETPPMDDAMSALLPGRDVRFGSIVGSVESARLVGIPSESNNLPGTLFLRSYLLPASHRNIWIRSWVDSCSPVERAFASFFGQIEFRSNPGPELVFSRPLLWAWAPVGLLLVIHFFDFLQQSGSERSLFDDA